jgi:phage-related protein (TIGR01555 family)
MRAPTPDNPGGERMVFVGDNVVNFAARIGLGAGNLMSETTQNYLPISRLQQLMEWAYRGSWIVGAAVDVVADDMTRAGIQMNSDTPPDQIEQINTAMNDLFLWQSLNDTIKWARLYGGALMVMAIEGQDMSTPLIPERVPQGALKGFIVLDRWMVQPTYSMLIQDFGPDYGMPVFYDVVQSAPFMPKQRIHYTRLLRMDGVTLPFRQRLAENGWGMSVIERLYDRLLAFDSGTMGAAQLLYKAYLRTYKVAGYRRLIGAGGELEQHFHRSMELMRYLQTNEGLTVIDKDDEFETHQYSFAGIPDTLQILGQQIAGALGIPLTRLFGQSPAGQNATGDSDWRNYETMVKASQEARLRRPLTRILDVVWQSELGTMPPDTWGFTFRGIDEPDEAAKAEIAQRDADTIKLLHDSGIITTTIALKELKQNSIVTGRFTNITEEDIKDSEQEPAPWSEEAREQQQMGGPGGGSPFGGGGGGGEGSAGPKLPGSSPPQPKMGMGGGEKETGDTKVHRIRQ